MNIIKNFLFSLALILPLSSIEQVSTIKFDSEGSRFNNVDKFPCCKPVIVEGEIAKNVAFVELSVCYSRSQKVVSKSAWKRSINNASENFAIRLTENLLPNTNYDFEIITYTALNTGDREGLKKNLIQRINTYLKQNITIERKKIVVDRPNKIFDHLNEIIYSALKYQRSLNGIEFTGLSDIVKQELRDLNEVSLRSKLRSKKRNERAEISEDLLNEQIIGLLELIYSELHPFLSSELVQLKSTYNCRNVETEKSVPTIPVNIGFYGYTLTQNANNISTTNSGILPGAGLTLPFRRPLQIKQKKIGELGISFGVLFKPISGQNDISYGIPGIKLPVYTGIGFKTLKILRLNVGTVWVSDLNNPVKLKVLPFVGLNFEFDIWLGIRK